MKVKIPEKNGVVSGVYGIPGGVQNFSIDLDSLRVASVMATESNDGWILFFDTSVDDEDTCACMIVDVKAFFVSEKSVENSPQP